MSVSRGTSAFVILENKVTGISRCRPVPLVDGVVLMNG